MFLTKDEEKTLSGEYGWVLERAIKLLITLGELKNAEKLVPIRRSHIAGVSYKTSGEPTLELLESLVSEELFTKTFATQNPAGTDLERWREMGIKREFADKQQRICKAYEQLGIKAICTCTPYLSGNRPIFGEVIGFSESSAISYANSVLGAKTNRHGALDALSAALIGKVPLMGYLLDENRLGDILVKVKYEVESESDYGALGYFVGKNIEMDIVPCYEGLKGVTVDKLKLLGAASAASGSVALYHVLGITPEAKKSRQIFKQDKPLEILEIFKEDLIGVYNELNSSIECNLIALGCPHCSLQEVKQIAETLRGKKIKSGIRLWVFTSPKVYMDALKLGYIQEIQSSGGDVFRHTCMVVMPIEDMNIMGVATNSAKAAFYIPRITQNRCQAQLLSLKKCVDLAT